VYPVVGDLRQRDTRRHRAGYEPVVDNEAMYRIRERFFDFGDDYDITDDSGQKVYHVDGKVLSLRNRLVLEDAAGREVASVHRRLVAMRPAYEITIGGEEAAVVRKNLFTPFREKFTIDVPGPNDLEMKGDLFDHEFMIERDGREVATVSKRWFSVRDTYGVQIAEGENHALVLAAVLALELALAREAKKDSQ
jgi:uncharacterized protein YxjI